VERCIKVKWNPRSLDTFRGDVIEKVVSGIEGRSRHDPALEAEMAQRHD
jgi:hypothetical protein